MKLTRYVMRCVRNNIHVNKLLIENVRTVIKARNISDIRDKIHNFSTICEACYDNVMNLFS
jgi:hypothetical protein